MCVASMRFRDTLRSFLLLVFLATLGSSEDLSGLGRETRIYHGDMVNKKPNIYHMENGANRIILRETISSTDNNVYVAFITKTCYGSLHFNCRFIRVYKNYDQMRNTMCEMNLGKKFKGLIFLKCRNFPERYYRKNYHLWKKTCKLCGGCWRYVYIKAKCRLPSMRIVHGFLICELEPNALSKPLIAKINLNTGETENQILLKDANITSNCLKSNSRFSSQCHGTIDDINVHIMIDNGNLWVLYSGNGKGILKQLNVKTLSTVKTIYVDDLDNNNKAIIVSNKLYILSIMGNQLSIVKAVDTNNPKNKMSRTVTLINKFKHRKHSWMHYNPRLEQLFTGERDKGLTRIYEVEKCAYAFPKFIDFDESPVKSTFLWSLYPSNPENYKYIIQAIAGFLRVTNHKHLKIIKSVLLSCPYTKCHHAKMSHHPYCRLKDIRSLFESFAKYKDPDFVTSLQVHFDMVKVLEQSKFREMSNKLHGLQNVINRNFLNIKTEIDNLRSNMGSYFTEFANFDSKKFKSDLELFHSVSDQLNNKQNKIASILRNKLTTLFKEATTSNLTKNAGQLANIVIAAAAFVNPFSFFDSSDKILQLHDRIANVAKAVVDTLKLGKIINVYIPRIRKLGDDLKPKIISMSKVFPNIRTLVNKAMNKTLGAKQLDQYVDVFLKEYDSYKPAFEPSTINVYEAVLSEIVNELCRILYQGKSLVSDTTQGILTSKGTCLATKLDVQTLMDLHRNMFDKQKSLMESFASAIRTAAARVNVERFRDIQNQLHTGQFVDSEINYKLTALEMLINSMIHTLRITQEACTLIRYKNADVMPRYCTDAIKNAGISSSDSVISSRLNRDMCDGENILTYVHIPAQQQSKNSPIPNGTIDLTRLYRGDEVIFQIPSADWLIEHKWITGEKKQKMIVLKEFELFIPANNSSNICVKSTNKFLSQNIIKPGGKMYDLSEPKLYQYNFEYSQGEFQCRKPMLASTPYELPSCPNLPRICIKSKGAIKNTKIYPSLYSKFSIKLSTIGNIPEIYPKTKFYLMASVRLCIIEPIEEKRKRSQTVDTLVEKMEPNNVDLIKRKRSPTCCGKSNEYYDPLNVDKPCKQCPGKTIAKLYGLYCD